MEFIKQAQEIPLSSSFYPTEWKTLSNPPERVYAVGDISLLKTRKFTIVGSRRTPAPISKLTQTTAKELSFVFTLVTGTADGGDTDVIEGALLGSGKVICILAGGFSAIPQGNLPVLKKVAERGLLLSPHPHDTCVRAFSYEYRNKLLAALGEGTLVVSAGEKSGALITAKYATEFEKSVFAFPYPPNAYAGAGCNALLKKGGYLTENIIDICERFGIHCIEKKGANVSLSPDEEALLTALKKLAEGHINELSASSGIPLFKARALLSALEVKGVVASLGGNRYAPV